MAVHLSTIKRARQSKKRRLRNRMMKTAVRKAEKQVRQAGNKDDAAARLREAGSVFDKAAAKGVLPRKTVSRHKSRLAKHVNKMEKSASS